MCPLTPLPSDLRGAGGGGGEAQTDGGGSIHTPPSPEEIEKKLNIYHKGAKIWKMLIFCQVGLSPSCPGVGPGWRMPPPEICTFASARVEGTVVGHPQRAVPSH